MRRLLPVLAVLALSMVPGAPAEGADDVTPPTITVTSPASPVVAWRDDLRTGWTCADEPGGSGLADCTATVPAGSPLATAGVGFAAFTITATDLAGNTTERTVRYLVVPSLECDGEPVTVFAELGQRATEGDDVILGWSQHGDQDGGDTINARGGDDIVCAGQGPDSVRGGAGDDRIFGGSRNDVLLGGTGGDWIAGGVEADYVDGGRGNDVILGDHGADRLAGGDGRDWLNGGTQPDRCWGGDGRDAAVACELRRGLP